MKLLQTGHFMNIVICQNHGRVQWLEHAFDWQRHARVEGGWLNRAFSGAQMITIQVRIALVASATDCALHHTMCSASAHGVCNIACVVQEASNAFPSESLLAVPREHFVQQLANRSACSAANSAAVCGWLPLATALDTRTSTLSSLLCGNTIGCTLAVLEVLLRAWWNNMHNWQVQCSLVWRWKVALATHQVWSIPCTYAIDTRPSTQKKLNCAQLASQAAHTVMQVCISLWAVVRHATPGYGDAAHTAMMYHTRLRNVCSAPAPPHFDVGFALACRSPVRIWNMSASMRRASDRTAWSW